MMKKIYPISWIQHQTDPLLLKAQFILSAYSKSTGAQICIMDLNYLSIPEIFNETTTEKNFCLYCMKHRLNLTVNKNQDYVFHPCREMHINGMKNAFLSGGSHIYKCELGFNFWSSPVYSGRRFVGAFIGSGFLDNDKQETAEKIQLLGNSIESKNKILERLSPFPRADSQHVKALAELMLICAESLSQDSGDYHETIKRRAIQQKEIMAEQEKLREKYLPNDPPPKHPVQMEESFLEAVRLGDALRARQILNELLGLFVLSYSEDFKIIQFRVIELAVLLSRMENTSLCIPNTYFGMARQFLQRLNEVEDLEELFDTLHLMTRPLA